ncbi:MAG: glutamate-1-semialdehyde 2,1-aminomutase [Bacteroidota bacterium]
MINRNKSGELFSKAKEYFPGGVNSPVRAFKAVNGTPLFIEKGDGSRIWDADGNEFIDFCNSWGPLILGHNNPVVRTHVFETIEKGTSFGAPTRKENELAELILDNHRFIEKLRFVSSGTEAVMSALRLARGYTGRDKVIKFDGCYHGHVDAMLVNAGSGLVTLGESSSAGIPKAFAEQTIVLPLNSEDAITEAFANYKDQIAAIIIEPVPANNGLLIQGKTFLEFLRKACTENGALLIFDEVISGFRVGFEGAAGFYGIQPDICTFGKIIGGGFPVGAYGASKEIMGKVSPDGNVYQAGTLSGNPVAMAAGFSQLSECLKPGFYESLKAKTDKLVSEISAYATSKNYVFRMFSVESIFWIAFTDKTEIRKASEISASSMQYFKKLHESLLDNGVYLGPSGYEVGFISAAHTDADIEKTVEAFKTALDHAFS